MKKVQLFTCASILAANLFVAGCRQPEPQARQEPAAAAEQVRQERDDAKRAIQAKLDAMDRQLDQMTEATAKAGKKATKESKEAIAKMRAEVREMRDRAERMNNAASDNWKDAKKDLESAADNLAEGIKKAWDAAKT